MLNRVSVQENALTMNYFRWFEYIFLAIIAVAAGCAVVQVAKYGQAFVHAGRVIPRVQDHPVAVGHARMCPQGHLVKQELLKELSGLGAGDHVRIAVYRWTDGDLAQACIASARAGADIQIITDGQAPYIEGSMLGKLARAGIAVWLFTAQSDFAADRPPLMHHKFVVIHSPARQYYLVGTGSYNFTRSAASKNCENMLFINHPDLYQELLAEWGRLYNLSVSRYYP